MFGNYARAPLNIGIAVLVGALLKFIVPFFLPFFPADSMLYGVFNGVSENALFIMLAAIGAALLAAAVTESKVGGV
ncbi:MAG: hypothetical protein RI560_11080 [Natronomonas sp.]|nr:hypothetical protein [Natronomonas sp.]